MDLIVDMSEKAEEKKAIMKLLGLG